MTRAWWLLLGLAGCELIEGPGGSAPSVLVPQTSPTLPDPSRGLEVLAGPCQGYRHEALLEAHGSLYVGCGTDPGLFRSPDAALDAFDLLPAFESYRVYDLAVDGDEVFVAGGAVSTGTSILERFVDPDQPTTEVDFSGSAPFMRISNAQNIVITSDGRRMLDSLTGMYLGYFDGVAWEEGYYFNEASLDGQDVGYQISDLVAHGPYIYGVGSTISEPPVVFLPSGDGRATYHMVDVQLDLAPYGALAGVHVLPDNAIVVVGVDESTNRAVIGRCDSGCTDPTAWQAVDVDAVAADNGRLHAVHFRGEAGCAAGERFPQGGGGLALVSGDGGRSWIEVPGDMPLLSACFVRSDGSVVFGGDLGWMGVLR